MFSFDFNALGGVVGEALQKAKDDLEKGVDSALGIDPSTKDSKVASGPTKSSAAAESTNAEQPKNADQAKQAQEEPTKTTDTKEVPKQQRRRPKPTEAKQGGDAAAPSSTASEGSEGKTPKKKLGIVKKAKATASADVAANVPSSEQGSIQPVGTSIPRSSAHVAVVSSDMASDMHATAPLPQATENGLGGMLPDIVSKAGTTTSPGTDAVHVGNGFSRSEPENDNSISASSPAAADAGSSPSAPGRGGSGALPLASTSPADAHVAATSTQNSQSAGGLPASASQQSLASDTLAIAADVSTDPLPNFPAFDGSVLGSLPRAALEDLARQLQEAGQASQGQLVRHAEQVSYLQQVGQGRAGAAGT